MELDDVARRLDAAGADVTAVGTRIAAESPSMTDFGANASGPFGELARALHGQVSAALAARAEEAHALGAAVADLARSLRGAASAYRDVESTRAASTMGGGA